MSASEKNEWGSRVFPRGKDKECDVAGCNEVFYQRLNTRRKYCDACGQRIKDERAKARFKKLNQQNKDKTNPKAGA